MKQICNNVKSRYAIGFLHTLFKLFNHVTLLNAYHAACLFSILLDKGQWYREQQRIDCFPWWIITTSPITKLLSKNCNEINQRWDTKYTPEESCNLLETLPYIGDRWLLDFYKPMNNNNKKRDNKIVSNTATIFLNDQIELKLRDTLFTCIK